jgi:hypothetical protein
MNQNLEIRHGWGNGDCASQHLPRIMHYASSLADVAVRSVSAGRRTQKRRRIRCGGLNTSAARGAVAASLGSREEVRAGVAGSRARFGGVEVKPVAARGGSGSGLLARVACGLGIGREVGSGIHPRLSYLF